MTPPKILVTGGTGFIGGAVVRQLVSRNKIVRVLSRKHGRHPNVEIVQGDITEETSLRNACDGIHTVIHAVQFPNHPVENTRKGWTYLNIDGRGTTRMVAAARDAGVKKFVYLSGAGTKEGRAEPWFQAKVMAERAVRESGMDFTVFRPSWVYGPGDRSLNKFVSFARWLPFVPIVGSGRERVQPVYVEDLAAGVATSIDMADSAGRTFEIGGPEILTMREIVETVLRVVGKRKPVIPHPKPLMKFLSRFMQILPAPPLSPQAVDFVTMEELVDPAPFAKTFNINLHRLENALQLYL